jgi:hypothetical protein
MPEEIQYVRPQPVGEVFPDIEPEFSDLYLTAVEPPEFPPDPNVQIIITGVGTYRGLEVSHDYDFRSIVNVTHTGVGGTALYTTGDTALVTKGDTSLGDGTITIGRTNTDDVSVQGEFISDLIPNATSTYDIGSSSRRWDEIYATVLNISQNLNVGAAATIGTYASIGTNLLVGAAATIGSKLVVGLTTNPGYATLTVGNIDSSVTNRGALAVKTLPNTGTTAQAALYLEEQNGSEGWYVIVDEDGDLNFNNSGSVTDSIEFLDNNDLIVRKGHLGIGLTIATDALTVDGNARITGVLTATTFSGTATKVETQRNEVAGDYYPVFVDTNNTNKTSEELWTDAGLSYDPSTNTLTAGSFVGTASSATVSAKVFTQSNATNGAFYPTFVDTNNTNKTSEDVWTDAGLSYNPSTNTLTAGFFSGDGSGLTGVTAGSATNANNIYLTDSSDLNNNYNIPFMNVTGGGTAYRALQVDDGGLYFNPNTNTLTASVFSGAATNIQTVSIATNANFYPTFVDTNNSSATSEALNTDAGIIYNPSVNVLSTVGVIASGGFKSDSGSYILITTSGSVVTFTVTGVGSTSLTLA